MNEWMAAALLAVCSGGLFLQFFHILRELFPTERIRRVWYWAAAALDILAGISLFWFQLPLYLCYALLFVLCLGETVLLVPDRPLARLLMGTLVPFLLICVHGVLIPMLALLMGTSMDLFVENRAGHLCTVALASLFGIPLLWFQRKIVDRERMQLLLHCRSQRRMVCGAVLVLYFYLVVECWVYYYPFPSAWTPIFHLFTSLVALVTYFLLLWYAADVSAYIEQELKTRQIEKQLQRQVLHYRQYTQAVHTLRAFKHDCRGMVAAARRLIADGKTAQAQQLLSQMGEALEAAPREVTFCNHVVVDAILRECAARCEEAGVEFSASVGLPQRVGFNDLELCRIFGNLVENAVEACEQQPTGGRRWISVHSSVSGDWVTVEIANTYTGQVKLAGGLPLSQKLGRGEHGLGLLSVRTLVESRGGFLRIDLGHPGAFQVRLHLSASEMDGCDSNEGSNLEQKNRDLEQFPPKGSQGVVQ